MSDNPEILSQSWREWHTKRGDEMLAGAEEMVAGINEFIPTDRTRQETLEEHAMIMRSASFLAASAQAHYAAANVRARPREGVASTAAAEELGKFFTVPPAVTL